MRVIHVNQSDTIGGAAKAAARIHQALLRSGVDSRFYVAQSSYGDPTVEMTSSRFDRLVSPVRQRVARALTNRLVTDNPAAHEPALFSTNCASRLTHSGTDIAHLHWVSNNMLSIRAIAKLPMPVIWTLHDMWAFCGAEHHTHDDRFKSGYTKDNRPFHESGPDLNRWVWSRKRRLLRRPLQIVTPSNWLANAARESALMSDWPIAVIPNAIDTETWTPMNKTMARMSLGLPESLPLVLFGAMGGSSDLNKGFDLLTTALERLSMGGDLNLKLLAFGGSRPDGNHSLAFPAKYFGHLHDDLSLRLLYNAADVLVIPSRLENLPNTGVEALACGTPLVGFDVGGMRDLILHKETGYLARAQDSQDLAEGIRWVLAQRDQNLSSPLSAAARRHAEDRFSAPLIAQQYRRLYETVLQTQNDAQPPTSKSSTI